MRNRSRVEIISQILEVANGGGTTRSKIAYKVFLNYDQLKDCLKVLTQNGLLCYDLDSRTFKTTEKGLRLLNTYNRIEEMIKTPQP